MTLDGYWTSPANLRRLEALHSYDILDTEAEAGFDELTRLASQLCNTPVALVTLLDENRQWFKSRVGVDFCEMSLEHTFCAHALNGTGLLVVPDTTLDPRFAENPLVVHDPRVRFYAGAPLVTDDGFTLGTLCVLDVIPRQLTDVQLDQLAALGKQVMSQLVLHRQAVELSAEVAARRASELELTRSQAVVNGLLEATDRLVFALDLDGRFVLANAALHHQAGLAEGAMIGLTIGDVFPDSTIEEFRDNDAAVVRTGEQITFTEHLRHPDGTVHEYLSTKFPLRDESGIYAVGGISTDVSDLARQRHQLEDSERRWRAMIERSPVATVVVWLDGVIGYANAPAARLHGATVAAELIGRQGRDFVPEDGQAGAEPMFRAVAAGTDLLGQPWRLRQIDGSVLNVVIDATSSELEGRPAVQMEMRDVSAQHRAEAALRESESRWRSLFQDSPIGISISDEDGRLITVNSALCTLLGACESDLLARTVVDSTPPDELEELDRLQAMIDSSENGVVSLEQRYVRTDGEMRWGWLTLTRVEGPDGRPWTMAHLQDVTERKTSQQAVVDSERNLAAVSSVVKQIQTGADARQTIVDAGLLLASAGYVCLIEPTEDGNGLEVSATTEDTLAGVRAPFAEASVSARVFRSGEPVFLTDARDQATVSKQLQEHTEIESIYVVPVRSNGQVTAVLLVAWTHRLEDLDDRRTSVVRLLADQAGVALRQAVLMNELQGMALTDPLTQLANRRHWDQNLRAAMKTAARSGRPLTVAIADLDFFKRYNDEYGHPGGDLLLREFAVEAQACLRGDDTLARWGGEEFALALGNCTAEEAAHVLDRVRRSVPRGQTCSIGFATWDQWETAEHLLARVDQALYVAKAEGRNRVVAARNSPAAA